MEIATVGPYRVVEKLGEGGMGEVYRGHDTSLGRDVALKLLPRDLADDPERRARMLREARAAAALNHPNICTVYEVGEAAGRPFIAMEVVEGRSLSARIAEGPLSVDEVRHIGVQLADAVAHAHDRGIVHRDLKGANVMVTPEGRVKVLDFGLAAQVSDQQLTDLTTHSVALATQAHAVLGTLPYMAPEQLRGTPADARSDVWALGVVLYEMVSGKRPFDGTTGFALSAAILHEPFPRLPAGVPRALQSVVACCLEKEPGRRYQRAAELRAALEAVRAHLVARDAPVARVTRRHLFIVGALATVLIAAGATLWVRDRRRASDAAGQIQSLAVLPLQNLSGDPGEEYFVTGMHEALIPISRGSG
jgi:eukaryotic-like serine/threonine-protein kinase